MNMLRSVRLGWCGSCESLLTVGDVQRWGEGRDEFGSPVRVVKVKCAACGVKGFLTFTLDELKELERSASLLEREQSGQLIGRLVHGFRMDLDVVDSVEDFLLEWRSDERFRLASVPREDGKRVFLPDVVWSYDK